MTPEIPAENMAPCGQAAHGQELTLSAYLTPPRESLAPVPHLRGPLKTRSTHVQGFTYHGARPLVNAPDGQDFPSLEDPGKGRLRSMWSMLGRPLAVRITPMG